MTREEVLHVVAATLEAEFGSLLRVESVRRVRRVSGVAWRASIELVLEDERIHVADAVVGEHGELTPRIDAATLVRAIRRDVGTESAAQLPDELADFADFTDDVDDAQALNEAEQAAYDAALDARAQRAVRAGDRAVMNELRTLLPRRLSDPLQRGETLWLMAQIESSVGERSLARGYLEAAAREFADRFDLEALERAATLALELESRDQFAGSTIQGLLESSRQRLTPLESAFAAHALADLPLPVRMALHRELRLRTLAPGEILVQEGEPSRNVFVVKSGLVGVWLEKPTGGSWRVRSCFPGWLLGEGSVLGEADARCTATLRAARITEVWELPASAVREAMLAHPELAQRIAQTKQNHRIDSFFSMHETMGQLDAQVRDEMLSCIQRLETFDEDTLVLPADQPPPVACLVARGTLSLRDPRRDGAPVGEVGADCFYGVRDAIHRIASGHEAIARAGSTVAFFDAERLQQLCLRSPEQVVAVLERLG